MWPRSRTSQTRPSASCHRRSVPPSPACWRLFESTSFTASMKSSERSSSPASSARLHTSRRAARRAGSVTLISSASAGGSASGFAKPAATLSIPQ